MKRRRRKEKQEEEEEEEEAEEEEALSPTQGAPEGALQAVSLVHDQPQGGHDTATGRALLMAGGDDHLRGVGLVTRE